MTYRIANWNDLYETSESRKLKSLDWVPMPNKQDGLGFRRIAAERDKCDLLAAWLLIVQVASKSRREERGWLIRDGAALTADDLAMITGYPESVFERALSFFSSLKLGWLIADEAPLATPPAPADRSERTVSPGRPTQPTPAPTAEASNEPGESARTPGDHPEVPVLQDRTGEEKENAQKKRATALPTTEAEAVSMAGMSGVPKEYLVQVFQEHDSTEWKDNGRDITNWSGYVKQRHTKKLNADKRNESKFGKKAYGDARPAPKKPAGPPEWHGLADRVIGEILSGNVTSAWLKKQIQRVLDGADEAKDAWAYFERKLQPQRPEAWTKDGPALRVFFGL